MGSAASRQNQIDEEDEPIRGGGGGGGGGGTGRGDGEHRLVGASQAVPTRGSTPSNGKHGLLYSYRGRRVDFREIMKKLELKRNAPQAEDTTSEEETYKPPEITSVDIASRLWRNRDEHHTYEYDSQELIIRRGQVLSFAFNLDRPYDGRKEEICLELSTGKKPSLTKGTRVLFATTQELEEEKWSAKIEKAEEHQVILNVQPLYNCPVGRYSMSVIMKLKEAKRNKTSLTCDKSIYILFNPWCEKDSVYMEKDDERQEFVLEDTGYIWYGSYKQIGKRRWNFGQFEDCAFDAAIYLLQDQDDALKDADRGNPILVSRKMTAAINAQDDGGVLVGRWDGDYVDGTRPTKWNGSVQILEEYMKEKDSVMYGQCWVFSGVLTTILRSLGMPARSVTNYASAHDTDSSMTVDKHFDVRGEPIEWMDSDSVWNFHVWNDCWMTRPDLPAGYGGWQAVDATPQETSEGIFQAGPASLNAIKQGHVYLPYDTRFIFAEINGDMVYWEASDGDYELDTLRCESSSVGRFLYTKAARQNKGEDVKGQYKHPEGSEEERLAVECAIQHGTKPNTYAADGFVTEDVMFELDTEDKVYIGSDFDVKIKLTNQGFEDRTISMSVIVQVCYYTGVLAEKIKAEKKELTISTNSRVESTVHVTVDEYVDKLVDQSAMKIFFMAKVKETKQIMAGQDDFRLRTPDVDLSVSETKPQVGQEFTATMTVKNPLPRILTNCTFNVEGAGLQRTQTIYLDDVPINGEVRKEVTLTARKPGKRTLVVDFDSDQLSQVHSDVSLEVTKA